MSLSDLLIGKPLATSEERAEHIGPIAGIPVFGLDALSSAAYGPEAALTLLIPLGLAGIQHIVPISQALHGLSRLAVQASPDVDACQLRRRMRQHALVRRYVDGT